MLRPSRFETSCLEPRLLLALTSAYDSNTGTLTITGGAERDFLSLTVRVETGFDPSVGRFASGRTLIVNGGYSQENLSDFNVERDMTGLNKIVINLGEGDDVMESFSITTGLLFDGNTLPVTPIDMSESLVVDGGNGNDTLLGGPRDDTLIGGAGNDFISTNSGFDSVPAGDGNDRVVLNRDFAGFVSSDLSRDFTDNQVSTVSGGAGNDTIQCQLGSIVDAGDGNDSISGSPFVDRITAGLGADFATGDAGDDLLDGGGGDDILNGNSGRDNLVGGPGVDRLRGNGGNDKLDGGDDADRLYGDDGADVLVGGSASDRLYGGIGNDRLLGNGSSDRLFGEAGDDTLIGSAGNDILDGGTGRDSADRIGTDTRIAIEVLT